MKALFPRVLVKLCRDNSDWLKWQFQLNAGRYDGVLCDLERGIFQRFKIRGYPKVMFFKNGVPTDYTADRTEDAVIEWMRKKSGPSTKLLKTVEEVEKFQKENIVCIIYFGNDVQDLKIFEGVALKFEDFGFGVVQDEKIAKNLLDMFVTVDQIEKATGLSKEEIEQLR